MERLIIKPPCFRSLFTDTVLLIILSAWPFFSENLMSQNTACAWTFFPNVSMIWERLFNWIIQGYFFFENRELSDWLKAHRLEASRCTSAAVWGEGFQLWIQTGKQSALHLSMLKCGNDFTIPHTMVGNIGRIQWWRLAHIFSQFPCRCPQSGTEDPRLLSAPQAEERA